MNFAKFLRIPPVNASAGMEKTLLKRFSGRPGNPAKIYLFNGLSLTIEILEKCAKYIED